MLFSVAGECELQTQLKIIWISVPPAEKSSGFQCSPKRGVNTCGTDGWVLMSALQRHDADGTMARWESNRHDTRCRWLKILKKQPKPLWFGVAQMIQMSKGSQLLASMQPARGRTRLPCPRDEPILRRPNLGCDFNGSVLAREHGVIVVTVPCM